MMRDIMKCDGLGPLIKYTKKLVKQVCPKAQASVELCRRLNECFFMGVSHHCILRFLFHTITSRLDRNHSGNYFHEFSTVVREFR